MIIYRTKANYDNVEIHSEKTVITKNMTKNQVPIKP